MSTPSHIALYTYQRAWIDSLIASRYSFVLGSRQIGKSWAAALGAIMLAGGIRRGDIEIPAHDVTIISADRERSRNILKEIKRIIKSMGIRIEADNASEVVLAGGGRILTRPGVAKSLQGFSGSVIVDELSLAKTDPEEIFAQALSVSSSRPYYRVWISTNSDVHNSFVDRFLHDPDWEPRRVEFALHDTSIYDAYPDGLPDHILKIKAAINPGAWSRFYENKFVTGNDNWFDVDAIARCTQTPSWSTTGGKRILSVDPGFSVTGNPSGVVVLETKAGRGTVLYSQHWQGIDSDTQIIEIKALFDNFSCSNLLVDCGGPARDMVQRLKPVYGQRLTEVSVSQIAQTRWYESLRTVINEGRLHIPPGHTALLDDLESIQDSPNGVVVPIRKGIKGAKIHADAAMALAYAVGIIGLGASGIAPAMTMIPIQTGWKGL